MKKSYNDLKDYYEMKKCLEFYKENYKQQINKYTKELLSIPCNKRDYLQLNNAKETFNNIHKLLVEIDKCIYDYDIAYTSNPQTIKKYYKLCSNVLA